MWQRASVVSFARIGMSCCFVPGLLWLSAQSSFAASCPVVHPSAPNEADAAFLAGDFLKAEGLYETELAKNPGDADLAVGLVHALLRQQKVQEAAGTVERLIGEKPAPAALLTVRGEVELRQGEPWTAAATTQASAKLDPCNPRTLLLFGRIAGLTSRYATQPKLLAAAHQLSPDDAEIRLAWIATLPTDRRIQETEAYLASPHGDDEETLTNLRTELEQLKIWAEEPRKPCTLASPTSTAVITMSELRAIRAGQISTEAVDVTVNDHRARLSMDTSYNPRLPIEGVSGLLILRSVADHMGLKPIFKNMVPGIGPQGPRAGYVAIADSISVGGVEFNNCAVQVMDGPFWNDADGAVSLTLLSDFLVTIDYPSHKILLGPLPTLPAPAATPGGRTDRYLAPEMKDYTTLYRPDGDLVLPVSVNGKSPMLFLLDTSIFRTMLSPEAGHEIAEGHKSSKYEVRPGNGTVDYTFSAGEVKLSLAHLTQSVARIGTFDTTRFTMDGGMAISGVIGDETLHGLTIHVDYRDGLIKMDFDPKRGGAFSR